MRVRITDNYGLAILRDSTFPAPQLDSKSRDGLQQLKADARDGRIFFIDGEDPIDMTIEVLVDQPVPEDVAELFEPKGGTFLLHAPSGKLMISGYEAWRSASRANQFEVDLAPGSYSLLIYSREHFDPDKYKAKMEELIGASNWSYSNKVDYLSFLGCLPTLATIIALVNPRWRGVAIYLAAFSFLAWLPFFILKRTRRYREAENRRETFSRNLPVYILVLKAVEDPSSLVGGYI